jgi:hypothetical protein
MTEPSDPALPDSAPEAQRSDTPPVAAWRPPLILKVIAVLRFQFDVGSVINEALAPGVDGFVGINVTALALTLLLVNYHPDKPTPSPLERRLFPTERR